MASSSDNPLTLLQRLKERKLVQWTLGYLAGAFVVLQLMDALEGPLGLGQAVQQGVLVLLVVGFPVTLVLGWYHGEQGRQRVSGPELLIITGLLVVSGLGIRFFASQDAGAGAETNPAADADAPIQPSVAVLPFVNMSGNPENEYFSDGITEELLNALAQLPGLRVPGRTSSFAFKDQNITIQQIADTLDVAHVLEGSVRRDGDRVLITAQLVDAQTDSHLWSETFERELEDIFAIQREIATAIADQLQVTLSAGEEMTLVAEGTESPEAHEAYLRGRFLWNQRTVESLRGAIAELERATETDPGYAQAWSGLADAHVVLLPIAVAERVIIDPVAELEAGLDAARRAVEIAPELGMAQASLGRTLMDLGEWTEADQAFSRALNSSPGYATAHDWYALFLLYTGRAEEGIGHAREATRLDPVSRISALTLSNSLRAARRHEEAVEQYRRTIELDPDWPQPWFYLVSSLMQLDEWDEARAANRRWIETLGLPPDLQGVMMANYEAIERYQRTGEPQPVTRTGNPELDAGDLMRSGGDPDEFLGFLEGLTQMGLHGPLAGARAIFGEFWEAAGLYDDPRYQAILEEAGITW